MSYQVIVAQRAGAMLLSHVRFLSRVSLPAARKLRSEYARILQRLEDNPLQFPVCEDLSLPEDVYRQAIFAKRYKAIFMIEGSTVYLDAVLDCRQDNSGIAIKH